MYIYIYIIYIIIYIYIHAYVFLGGNFLLRWFQSASQFVARACWKWSADGLRMVECILAWHSGGIGLLIPRKIRQEGWHLHCHSFGGFHKWAYPKSGWFRRWGERERERERERGRVREREERERERERWLVCNGKYYEYGWFGGTLI